MAKTVICDWPESSPTTYLDHYEVWRKTGSGGTYAKISGDIAQGTLTYTDTSTLSDSTEYFYEVRAYNATGDYNAVENSIIISGSSIIVMQDDFAGTDLAGNNNWTVTDPVDGVTISQNNALIMTSDRDATDVPSTLTNGIESKVGVPTSAEYSVLQFDAVDVLNIGVTGSTSVVLRKDGDQLYSIGLSPNTSNVNNAGISIYNSTEVYNFESAVPMAGKTWKIVYKHDTHDIGVYYWNTNVWTQIGATQNEDISQGGANDLVARFGQSSNGTATTGTFTGQIENVYLSSSNYPTETPE